MMHTINILIIDDDQKLTKQLEYLLQGEIAGHEVSVSSENDFHEGKNKLYTHEYDIVILDLYKGPVEDEDNQGAEVLSAIKQTAPIIVIIHTALQHKAEELLSDMVHLVAKDDDDLKETIESLINMGLPLIKQNLTKHINQEMTKYYWELEGRRPEFTDLKNEHQLFEYLIIRRMALSLSDEAAKKLLGGDVALDTVHPMSMYVVPPVTQELYEMGDILRKRGEDEICHYVILTPSCDFVQKNADYVLLATAQELKGHPYLKGKALRGNEYKNIIKSKLPRYYFLPNISIQEMPDLVIDLQNIRSVPINCMHDYEKLAKLDYPYSQDLQAKFTRYQNRPGSPDIDISGV